MLFSVPGLVTVIPDGEGGGVEPEPPLAVNAAVPLGEPRPVGPSQPVPAVHSAGPQPPLLPEVTSNSEPVWEYGYAAG